MQRCNSILVFLLCLTFLVSMGLAVGAQFDPETGQYQGGASGMGQLYVFYADGTYQALVIWQDILHFAGRYTTEDEVLLLTDRIVRESQAGGGAWSALEALPDASAYFLMETDDQGPYLLLGGEGAEPPLVHQANAVKYRFVPSP